MAMDAAVFAEAADKSSRRRAAATFQAGSGGGDGGKAGGGQVRSNSLHGTPRSGFPGAARNSLVADASRIKLQVLLASSNRRGSGMTVTDSDRPDLDGGVELTEVSDMPMPEDK